MAARKKKRPAPRAPFASPAVTALLFAALLFLVVALALEGDWPLAPSAGSPTPTPTPAPTVQTQEPSTGSEAAQTGFELHVLAVGKADCLLLRCDGQTMLVDGGNTGDEAYIKAYLQAQGVDSLDYVVNTHPHEDHLGALDRIVLAYPVGQAFLSPKPHTTKHYEELLDALEEKQVETSVPEPGDTLVFGGATITFLSPDPDADFGDEINDWSLVFVLEYGQHRFLFMGDAESAAEKALRESGFDLSADVLKVGHHGSDSSSKNKFLDAVSPSYAVITCDKNEEKGEPSEKVLERLAERGVQVFRTDEQGDVVIRSDGQSLLLPAA